MDKILIVEDEEDTLQLVSHIVRADGFDVAQARNGKQALQVIDKKGADAVILDRFLPDMDGLRICEHVQQTNAIPIIVLSALTTEADKVAALNMGADDYVGKPFQPGELTARLRAHLRRATISASSRENERITAGDIIIDLGRYEVYVGGEMVTLSPKEFELLTLLARHRGRVLRRNFLLNHVWGPDFYGDARTLDVHVCWLREKIEEDPGRPKHLVTVRGVGYKLRD